MIIKYSKEASYDIEDIWDFTASKWSKRQANKYFNEIFDKIEQIDLNDYYKEIIVDKNIFYSFQVKSHLIFFEKISPNSIKIIRVLHKSMDHLSQLSQ